MKFIHHQGIMAKPSSPISTVPYELLAEIMFLALGSGLHLGYVPTPSDVLVLCQVCSFWRQAALNTPRLWTIEVLPSMKGKIPSIVTEMFLERSAPLPISVFIDPKRYRNVDLSPVIAAAHRWKTLHLTYDPEFTWSGLAGIPPNSLANLERLWFRPDGLELDTFLTASSLRDVTIHVPHMSFQIPLIPWAQLTRLQLLYDSPQPCLDIIVHCASLVSAHIVTKQWFPSDSPDAFPIGMGSLAHLEELNIEMGIRSTGEHLGPFLRRLRLPALKSLTLLILTPPDLDDYFIEWCTPDLISFLARAPNVCNLELDDCIYAEDIADVLQNTRNLTRLILSNTEVDNDFFECFRYSETDATPLVPKLENLLLWDVGRVFDHASVTDMIKSRSWSDDELLAMPTPPRVTRLTDTKIWSDYGQIYPTKEAPLVFS